MTCEVPPPPAIHWAYLQAFDRARELADTTAVERATLHVLHEAEQFRATNCGDYVMAAGAVRAIAQHLASHAWLLLSTAREQSDPVGFATAAVRAEAALLVVARLLEVAGREDDRAAAVSTSG